MKKDVTFMRKTVVIAAVLIKRYSLILLLTLLSPEGFAENAAENSSQAVSGENVNSEFCGNLDKAFKSLSKALKDKEDLAQVNTSAYDFNALLNTLPSDTPESLKQVYQMLYKQVLILQQVNDIKSGKGFQKEVESQSNESENAKHNLKNKDAKNLLQYAYLMKEQQELKKQLSEAKKEFKTYQQNSSYDVDAANYYPQKCPKLWQENKNRNTQKKAKTNNLAKRHATAEDSVGSQPPILLQTGATAEMDGVPVAHNCVPKFATKITSASIGNQLPPGMMIANPTQGMRYVAIQLELTNNTQPSNEMGSGLCKTIADNIVKTIFRMKADDQVFDNKYPIYKWPDIAVGSAGLVELFFEIPAATKELTLTGDTDDKVLATWQLEQ